LHLNAFYFLKIITNFLWSIYFKIYYGGCLVFFVTLKAHLKFIHKFLIFNKASFRGTALSSPLNEHSDEIASE
jgi:hypothetical protein